MSLVETLRKRAEEEELPLRVILKEALQVYTLAALYSQPASDQVIFQGGTCLRLVYSGPRYSEDLDFVTVLDRSNLSTLFEQVRDAVAHLAPLFDAEITARVQKATPEIVRWRIYCASSHPQASISISLEFAPYPAYTGHARVLRPPADLPALPLVIVEAEALEEIMADKVVAFAGRRYVKGRDVFDVWWLKHRGVTVQRDLVRRKMADYGVSAQQLYANLAALQPSKVRSELERFLPIRYRRQLLRPDTLEAMVAEVKTLLENAVP